MDSNKEQKVTEDKDTSETQNNISHMAEELVPSVSDSETKPETDETGHVNSDTIKGVDTLESEEPMQIDSPSAEEVHAARQAQLALSGADDDDYGDLMVEDNPQYLHYYDHKQIAKSATSQRAVTSEPTDNASVSGDSLSFSENLDTDSDLDSEIGAETYESFLIYKNRQGVQEFCPYLS